MLVPSPQNQNSRSHPGQTSPQTSFHSVVTAGIHYDQDPIIDFRPVLVEANGPKPGQETQTDDVNDSLVTELSTSSLFRAPFPPNTFPIHHPTRLSIPLRLNFALYPVSRFSDEFWKKIWNEPILVLDPYLTALQITPGKGHPTTTYFHPETEFMGIKFRLKVDPSRSLRPLTVQRGDTVDICRTNTCIARYVVESCQLIRDGLAYFPVHYRSFDGQGFTDTQDPRHPSFILEVPESFCNAQLMPHLRAMPSPNTFTTCDPISTLVRLMFVHRRTTASTQANEVEGNPRETLGNFLYMVDEQPVKKRSYFCLF